MNDTFNYSFVKNDEGAFALRSTVKSFNLEHVTDKDIVSFYHSFSSYASFDTGLLPLNGTGVLAIRSAGPHTQIVTQHQAGMYYLNWGAYEKDSSAKTYYVAQPYRIVIGDFEGGNLLGARMFYSPYPITNPSQELYHVNLPNINCKGYRGNGVGWICLYHNDDWSSLPFNEKVSCFIERCSGVETYNDANMSETDGPRFYASKNKPSYFYNPSEWQSKSESDGFQWTLDSELLIPVLVKDMDNQDKHYDDGQPLTLAMAMLGNYQAYYHDKSIPKMYNVISRSDLTLDNKHIAEFIKKSFALAPAFYSHQKKDDPYSFTVQHRQDNGAEKLALDPFADQNDSEDTYICIECEEDYSEGSVITTAYDTSVCEDCISNDYVYIEHLDAYYSLNDEYVVYSNFMGSYFHLQKDSCFFCTQCQECFGKAGNQKESKDYLDSITYFNKDLDKMCHPCFLSLLGENTNFDGEPDPIIPIPCFACSKDVVDVIGWSNAYPTFKAAVPNYQTGELELQRVVLCQNCAKDHFICPCGLIKQTQQGNHLCTPTAYDLDDKTVTVNACCESCLGNATEENGFIAIKHQPFNSDIFNNFIKSTYIGQAMGVSVKFKDFF